MEGEEIKNLLSHGGVFVNFTRLLLALTLEVVEAISIPLPVQVDIISLRLFFIQQKEEITEKIVRDQKASNRHIRRNERCKRNGYSGVEERTMVTSKRSETVRERDGDGARE